MSRLFAFGLGFSAQTLAERLAGKGWQIAGTARDVGKIGHLAERGYEIAQYSGEAGNSALPKVLHGTTHLLHSIPPGPEGDPVLEHYREELAKLSSLEWVGYLSTVGVYGHQEGRWVDETTAPRPNSARTEARVQAEQAWLDFGKETGVPVQVFRLAGIYGPGPQRVRQAESRHGAAHQEGWAGVQPHPCRGHRLGARSLDRAAACGRDLQCRRRRARGAR